MKKVSIWFALLLAAAAVCVTLAVQRITEPEPVYGPEEKLAEAMALIDRYYIGEADRDAMTDSAIDGMVQSLGDRWSYYMTAEELASYLELSENSYVGLGIVISAAEEGGIRVQSVYAQSPAGEAEVLPGSRFLSVGEKDLREATLDEATLMIREAIDAGFVRLTLLLPDGTEQTYEMTPAAVLTDPVAYEMLEDGLGLVRIANFDGHCAERSIAAIQELTAQGAWGLIFDVRLNPGGQLSELLELLDYLLPEGPLFHSEDTEGRKTTDYSGPECLELPMAVLVNADSYSAAEFFAAALAEYDWAVTVGEQTSGKGYAQTIRPLSDGSALYISGFRYTTPQGVSLAGVGLTPQIAVELSYEDWVRLYADDLPPEEDEQLQAAVEFLQEQQG